MCAGLCIVTASFPFPPNLLPTLVARVPFFKTKIRTVLLHLNPLAFLAQGVKPTSFGGHHPLLYSNLLLCSLNLPDLFLPQAFCTCGSVCLEFPFSRHFHEWLLCEVQLLLSVPERPSLTIPSKVTYMPTPDSSLCSVTVFNNIYHYLK